MISILVVDHDLTQRALDDNERERAYKLGALALIQRSPDFRRELTWIRAEIQQVVER